MLFGRIIGKSVVTDCPVLVVSLPEATRISKGGFDVCLRLGTTYEESSEEMQRVERASHSGVSCRC
jgi:hypothetical protein